MKLNWLEVRFRNDAGSWHVQLVPEDLPPRAARPWQEPLSQDALFFALFDQNADRDLIKRCWRLRLRPELLMPVPGPMPAINSWALLRHPDNGSYLLDIGWTISQLVVWPTRGETSGTVAVIGSDKLVQALNSSLGPRAVLVQQNALLPRALLVVEPLLDEKAARGLQEAAIAAACPLILWCVTEAPHSRAAEVVPVGSPKPVNQQMTWLVSFLSLLLGGQDPELAFAEAGLSIPPKERQARLLRGAFAQWHVDTSRNIGPVPHDWYIRLDRAKQEHELNGLANDLVWPNAKRRVLIVVTPGPNGSGLVQFRRRKPLIDQEVPPIPLIPWDPPWSEVPARQEETLRARVDAKLKRDMPERLLAEANRLHRERSRTEVNRALFWIRHETASLEQIDELRHVTEQDLRCYFAALGELAEELTGCDLRILVHVSIQGATQEQLMHLNQQERYYSICVLPTLPVGIPEDELRTWLNRRGLEYSEEEVKEMLSCSYDELIQCLYERYPELRFV